MASLSATKVKDTYVGLLKTTDNTGITSTLKRVTDGAGSDTGLYLSDAKAKVDALEIVSVSQNNTRTKFLNWDASDGIVGYYDFTASDPAVSASIASDDVTITTGTNAANTFTLISGTNITLSLSGTDVTIDAATGFDDWFSTSYNTTASVTPTLTSAQSGLTFDLSFTGTGTGTITLPTAAAGLRYTFVVSAQTDDRGSFTIQCGASDGFAGGLAFTNNGFRDASVEANNRAPYTVHESADPSTPPTQILLDPDAVTSGGEAGTWITCVAISDSTWLVNGHVFQDKTYTEFVGGSTDQPGMPATLPALFS